MKKITALVLCLLLVVSAVSVVFAEGVYTLVLPGWMESDDYDPSVTEEAMGAQFVERDADGNFIFSINEEARITAIADAEAQLADAINQMVNDETGLIVVSKVDYNDDLSQIGIHCENDQLGFEALYATFLSMIAWQRQILLGYMPSEFVCTLTFYNPAGETIETTTLYDAELRDLVESMQESSTTDIFSGEDASDVLSDDEQDTEIDISEIIDLPALSDDELKAIIINAQAELNSRHANDITEKMTIEFDGFDIDFSINSWRLVDYYDGMGIEFDVTTVNNTEYDIEIGMRDIEINGWLVMEDGFYRSITSLGAGKKMKDSFSISDWDMADVTAFEQIETIDAEVFLQDENSYSKLATVQISWSIDDLMAIPHEE